ncbi:MAG: peptidylprolyl isomerase [Clostridiales bacterium]|nr:peptidylprolyl isomerase [Clostridiales bacterium]
MDDNTNLTPEQTDMQNGAEVSFTITGEDAEAQEALNAKKPGKKKSPLPWIIGGAAVVIAAALVLILALKPKTVSPDAEQPGDAVISEPADTPDGTDSTQPDDQTPAEDDQTQTGEETDGEQTKPAGNGVSYTISADELTEDVLNREIAVCGDDHLTNRELPYYYWQQYYSLMNNYGSYASYFIDASTPFDQQMCMFDNTLTWQQYFLQGAVSTYKSVSALWQDARLSGFQLGEEDQDYLDGLSNTVTVSAASYGYESADAYLQTAYGPAATMTGYHDFVERYLTASAYLQALVEAKTYTEADISAYFDENADTYAASSIEKSDVNMVNVRHILIVPEEKNDDGTYTDAAWTAAEQKAQALLDEWKAGEHTEDSFAFLAAENSADTGSASNGGLYEEVYPGQMVDAFDAWCFDAARQPGDTGIVKTEYGYHVMYFSSVCEHPYWYVRAESDYLNKLSADVSEEVSAKFESAESVQNAALADILQN